MFFLPFPIDIDIDSISRDLKLKPIYVKSSSVTRLKLNYEDDTNTLHLDFNSLDSLSMSTVINFSEHASVLTSTWNDYLDYDFDVVSKMTPSKSIKIKVKVSSISRFNPKISID